MRDLDQLRACARDAVAEYRALERELPTRRIPLGMYLQPTPFEAQFLHEVRALLGWRYDLACEHHEELLAPTTAVSTLWVRPRPR